MILNKEKAKIKLVIIIGRDTKLYFPGKQRKK